MRASLLALSAALAFGALAGAGQTAEAATRVGTLECHVTSGVGIVITSSRGLFANARRAYSHGCVRVEQPLHLAELVMGGAATGWPESRVQSMLGSNERAVFLPTPLPIHLEYFTEFVDETGVLRDREDIYGLTGRVAATLSKLRQD